MLQKFFLMLKNEFHGYNTKSLRSDIMAGATVAAVALPLALAYGVSSGASAAAGLITAIIAGFLIGGLSGASYQLSGPTGAMTAILLPLIAREGLKGMFIACFISGIILILAGVFKLGNVISYIPLPVIAGFTTGNALIIFISQLDNITGMKSFGDSSLKKLVSYFTDPTAIRPISLIIGAAVILFMLFYPKKFVKIIPSSLAAIIIITVLNKIFGFDSFVVGKIPNTIILPQRLSFFDLNLSEITKYITPAISIAALSMVESLLCGASAGRMKNEKINSDIELVAQGVGNALMPFLGGVPATAAIARTSVAIKAGSKTRITSIVHSVVLMSTMLILAPVMSDIPLAALAGVLWVTAWRMNDWVMIKDIFKRKLKSAIWQFLITAIATIVFSLTYAIIIGIAFSLIMFLIKISDVQVSVSHIDKERLGDNKYCEKFKKTEIAYIVGPLYFGTVDKLIDKLNGRAKMDTLILSLRGVPLADLSAANALRDYCQKLIKNNTDVYLCGVQPVVMDVFERCGIADHIGKDKFYWSADLVLTELRNKEAC